MADVFLSYKREDQKIAREVADDLEAEGFSVFFDVRIEVGDSWDERIEAELTAAKAVVVLWSPKSRDSKWVKREAREALERRILCPAMIARCKVPLEFSDVQASDLIGRLVGDRANAEWRRLCERVGKCVGRKARGIAAPETPSPARPPERSERGGPTSLSVAGSKQSRRALVIGGVATTAVVAAGGYYGWTYVRDSSIERAWQSARTTGSRSSVRGFLQSYPNSPQAAAARELLATLPLSVRESAILRHDGDVHKAVFSPDGRLVATGCVDTAARLWTTRSGQKVAELSGNQNGVTYLAFSPDSAHLVTASGSTRGTARIWRIGEREPLAVLQHSGYITSACVSPDGERVLTASTDNTSCIWNLADGAKISTFRGHGPSQISVLSGIHSACFSKDGTRAITAGFDNNIRVWDARTARQLLELPGSPQTGTGIIGAPSLSPDGAQIIAADGNAATIWDAATGTVVRRLVGHELRVNLAQFSLDGANILTASASDQTARVWDSSGQTTAVLRDRANIHDASFSPDGKCVITTSDRGVIWTVEGREIATFAENTQTVKSGAFSSDGAHVITVSADSTARIWEVDA